MLSNVTANVGSGSDPHPVLAMVIQKGIFNEIPMEVVKTCSATAQPLDFKAEFTQLQMDTLHLRDLDNFKISQEYGPQNRYKDIFSAEEWLFRLNDPHGKLPFKTWKKQLLMWDGLEECPYINASRIGSHHGDIITQGPLSKTEDDFWKMVWNAQASLVVMLTPLFEDEKRKCSHYFPEITEQPFSFGQDFKIKVRLIQELYRNNFVNKELIMNHAGQERTLSIIHCSDWTDKQPYPIDRLVWLVVYTAGFAKGNPLIAHCSAGVGRSGTSMHAT